MASCKFDRRERSLYNDKDARITFQRSAKACFCVLAISGKAMRGKSKLLHSCLIEMNRCICRRSCPAPQVREEERGDVGQAANRGERFGRRVAPDERGDGVGGMRDDADIFEIAVIAAYHDNG